jgi:hypothetical protein
MEIIGQLGNTFSHHKTKAQTTRFPDLVPHPVDTATTGMDTHPSSPRTELDLITEQELARHLKICRRQLYNWRVSGTFAMRIIQFKHERLGICRVTRKLN